MFRNAMIFVGMVVLLGAGVAIAAWPRTEARHSGGFQSQAQLKSAFVRVHAGITPISRLTQLGFDTASAVKLSYLGVMEQFMPKDSFGFDALDPAVQNCLEAANRCGAYVFHLADRKPGQVVLLIEGGRVAYKTISGISGEASNQTRALRAAME